MVSVKILVKTPINSLTKEVFYWGIPRGIKIIGIYRQLLSIIYRRKEKN